MSTKTLQKESFETIKVPKFLVKTIQSISSKDLKKRIITKRGFTIAEEEELDKKLAVGMEDIKAGRVIELNEENKKIFIREFKKNLLKK
jgi:ribosomal protein L13E